jgi:hypothetical protein
VQTVILKNTFYRAGQGALGMSLWNQVGAVAQKSLRTIALNEAQTELLKRF